MTHKNKQFYVYTTEQICFFSQKSKQQPYSIKNLHRSHPTPQSNPRQRSWHRGSFQPWIGTYHSPSAITLQVY